MNIRSHPISVRNGSSKFTLTKKNFFENKKKSKPIHNNLNIQNTKTNFVNFPSEFSKFLKTNPNKKNTIKNTYSSRYSSTNKTLKSQLKNDLKNYTSFNNDFIKIFKQIDCLKDKKITNHKTFDNSINNKRNLINVYCSSLTHSKSKGRNNNNNLIDFIKKNKNMNSNKLIKNKSNTKSKNKNNNNSNNNNNILIRKNYIINNDNNNNHEKYFTLNNTYRTSNKTNSNFKNITNSNNNNNNLNNKKNLFTLNNNNIILKKNQKSKKNFNTFKPFHIKFAKPLQALKSDSKNKQSNITTYRINFSKLIPNKINLPYNNKINKTQEINNQINNNNLIALKKNINNKNKNINNNNNKILITN